MNRLARSPSRPRYNVASSGSQSHVARVPGRHALLQLQNSVGNQATGSLLRMIQRVSIGQAPSPTPKMTWEVMGGFASKHLTDEAISPTTAKTKWTERFTKDKKGVPNTVVAKDDFTAAVTGGKVTGSYPRARGPRGTMMVDVKGYTVFPGTGTDGKKVAGNAKVLKKIAVEGTSTESAYFPDHFDGKNSS